MFQIPEDPNVTYNIAWIGIISGVFAAFVSLIGIIWTHFNQKRLEKLEREKLTQKTEIDQKLHALEQAKLQQQLELVELNNRFQEQSAEKDARRDYEYEARKRLYEQCEPLLFQLVESSEDALHRIYSLARTASHGDLSVKSQENWLNYPTGYYFTSTVYFLLAPLVVYRLINQNLTMVDLRLSPHTHTIYQIIKKVFISFTDHFELAKIEPAIEYDPDNQVLPPEKRIPAEKYLRQGLYFGRLSAVVDKMIVREKEGKRCMFYDEFLKIYLQGEGKVSEDFNQIVTLFEGFHPKTRSVFWRVLVVQSLLYQRLILTRDLKVSNSNQTIDEVFPNLVENMKVRLDWRHPGLEAENDEVLEIPFAVAGKYLQEFIENLPVNSQPPSNDLTRTEN